MSTTPAGEAIPFQVNDEPGTTTEGLRVFAGLRLDPFFIDLPGVQATEKLRRLAFKDQGTNVLEGQNVMSIVIEAEIATMFDPANGPLFAVAAETVTAGKIPIRLERVGRPELKNVVLSSKEFDPVNRDLEMAFTAWVKSLPKSLGPGRWSCTMAEPLTSSAPSPCPRPPTAMLTRMPPSMACAAC